jgi:hypothetical protein
MNRSEIAQLQAIHGFPAVTILVPTEQGWPENRQNPIRVANLVREAEERLRSECSARVWTPLIARLDALAASIDYEHLDAGLALFLDQDIARIVHLPFPVREHVVVDETFATRALVATEQQSPRYWVLVLSERPTRLYRAFRDTLTEVHAHGFPMTYQGPGPDGSRPLPGGRGTHTSEYRDEYRRQFFRAVEIALGEAMAAEPLPLVITGVDRYLAYFREVSAHAGTLVGTVTGNYDRTLPNDLATLVWPVMQEDLARQQQQALDTLAAAVDGQRYVSGIEEVWRSAAEGRGELLLVESGFAYAARSDAAGMAIRPVKALTLPGTIDDAVDEIIETVIAKGGTVAFVPDGSLTVHRRIALVTRY